MDHNVKAQPASRAMIDPDRLVAHLRQISADAAVDALAHVAVINARALAEWAQRRSQQQPSTAGNGGSHEEPGSPAAVVVETLVALGGACRRYRNDTGEDGIARAHRIIAANCGDAAALALLGPLREAEREEAEYLTDANAKHRLDALFDDNRPIVQMVPVVGEATVARQDYDAYVAFRVALAEWVLTAPGLAPLIDHLKTMVAASIDRSSPAFHDAATALQACIGSARARETDLDTLGAALDWWSTGMGGPKITFAFDSGPERYTIIEQ